MIKPSIDAPEYRPSDNDGVDLPTNDEPPLRRRYGGSASESQEPSYDNMWREAPQVMRRDSNIFTRVVQNMEVSHGPSAPDFQAPSPDMTPRIQADFPVETSERLFDFIPSRPVSYRRVRESSNSWTNDPFLAPNERPPFTYEPVASPQNQALPARMGLDDPPGPFADPLNLLEFSGATAYAAAPGSPHPPRTEPIEAGSESTVALPEMAAVPRRTPTHGLVRSASSSTAVTMGSNLSYESIPSYRSIPPSYRSDRPSYHSQMMSSAEGDDRWSM